MVESILDWKGNHESLAFSYLLMVRLGVPHQADVRVQHVRGDLPARVPARPQPLFQAGQLKLVLLHPG